MKINITNFMGSAMSRQQFYGFGEELTLSTEKAFSLFFFLTEYVIGLSPLAQLEKSLYLTCTYCM